MPLSGPNPNGNEPGMGVCPAPGPLPFTENSDLPPLFCDLKDEPNQRHPDGLDMSWLREISQKKVRIGTSGICDPATTGWLRDQADLPSKTMIYRYSQAIRGTDEGVMDLFRDIEVYDNDGNPHIVPIIWGSQERAVAALVQDNYRKDETGVVDRISLPMMAIHQTDYTWNPARYTYHGARMSLADAGRPIGQFKEKYKRDTIFGVSRGVPVDIGYTLIAWTMYQEDMNEMLEQIIPKMTPQAYIRVRGVHWEIPVKLESIANNLETEPGDQQLRVIKFQFNLTAETYIPQPLERKKTVLKTRIELVEGPNENEVTSVLNRLEEAVKELEC